MLSNLDKCMHVLKGRGRFCPGALCPEFLGTALVRGHYVWGHLIRSPLQHRMRQTAWSTTDTEIMI